ncbi:hypothetical protein DMB66_27740 [Actinoplanes sp. ATCC 53533]|uniref:hypothetical protein n=1 Tax=Actinoplanes sp. ATCC 53533 TaxID=1288362 RepID=UPI000F78650A|nr:hypothetical protein [Actinoplanes sp. ATCC 53533]RSM59480.1 hypothetical protein DMB66_27740 [Actinoplanes sp. ATCC 53533]
MTDLEMWLIGTPDQATATLTALAAIGRVTGASKPEPLFGADAGRVRQYVRVSVITAVRSHPAERAAGPGERQSVIDISTRRRTA